MANLGQCVFRMCEEQSMNGTGNSKPDTHRKALASLRLKQDAVFLVRTFLQLDPNNNNNNNNNNNTHAF